MCAGYDRCQQCFDRRYTRTGFIGATRIGTPRHWQNTAAATDFATIGDSVMCLVLCSCIAQRADRFVVNVLNVLGRQYTRAKGRDVAGSAAV